MVFFLLNLLCIIVTHARNSIVIENEKAGTPNNEWDINGAGDKSIQGYAVPFSINLGESLELRIDTNATKYRIDIYRVGYYQGHGARKIVSWIENKPSIQPKCIELKEWRTVTCNNWLPTLQFDTKDYDTLISGVYFARLTRLDINGREHPHYNWRIDNSYISALSQFCEENCDSRPKPAKNAYGANGYGEFRHKLKEPYASHIYFIIRDDESQSDILMQTSDTTWHAYNRYGGVSTYGSFDSCNELPRALKMTYNRPIVTRDYRAINMLFSAEYPAIRFLEKNGFSVSYISGLDMSTFKSDEITMMRILRRHKLFLSVGHDEYWSWRQRMLITKAIQIYGLNAMFWSGNEMYWKIRFEDDTVNNISNGNPRMVIFKETRIRSEKLDKNSNIWTGTWRDIHDAFQNYEKGPYPENAITGQLYTVDVWRSDPIHIPWYYSNHKFWRNCHKINSLEIGDKYILAKPLIGHEFDEDIDNGHRPKGLQHLSQTTIDNVQYLLDWGIIYDTGSAQHHLTLYKSQKSGALVFGAGSIMFAWGLDDYHDSATGIPPHLENYYDCRALKDGYGPIKELQQAMFNLFADINIKKPDNINDNIFIYKKYDDKDIGKPVSWITYFDPNKSEKIKNTVNDKDGLRCIRIEGSSNIQDGKGIIAGIEIVVTNEYIDGKDWSDIEKDNKRWYAATIDYDKIAKINEKIDDIKEYNWYFEAFIELKMKDKLYVITRGVNDNGDVEQIENALYVDINLDRLRPCYEKNWIWRKRPVLNSVDIETYLQKHEL